MFNQINSIEKCSQNLKGKMFKWCKLKTEQLEFDGNMNNVLYLHPCISRGTEKQDVKLMYHKK